MSTETNNVDVAPVDAAPAPAAPAEATPSAAAAPAPSAAAPAAAPKVQSYDEAFPGLGGGPAPTQAAVSWFNNPMKSIKSSTTSIDVSVSGKAAAITEAKKQVLANLTQQGKIPLKQSLNQF